MPGSEPRHAAYILILHLDRGIRPAHQALAYEIDTMRDVAGGRHHRHSCVVDLLTRNGGGVESIIALSYAVLTG